MKFEYSDFYKFITSLGVALISLAMIVPWLFLKEPFDLLVKQDDLSVLTPLAQEILSQRQSVILFFLQFVPWFSLSSFLLGLASTLGGGIMWFRRTQIYLDRFNELNVQILEKRLAPQSNTQIQAQREEDVRAQLADIESEDVNLEPGELLEVGEIKSTVDRAFQVEKKFAELVESCFSDSHAVFTDRHIGPVSFDIVMASLDNRHADRIFEIKYIRKGFKYNWLRDNLYKIVYANLVYEKESNRKSTPHLFVVHTGFLDTMTDIYLARIYSEIKSMKTQADLTVMWESDFNNMSCDGLKTLFESPK